MTEGSEQHGGVSAPPIETLFWDLGGVLLTNGWDKGQRMEVLGRLGVDLAAYEDVHDRENWFWERGLITAKEFFNRTVILPNPQLDLTFEQMWPEVCGASAVLHAEVVALVRGLHDGERSFRMATLNNESRELNEYRLSTFGLGRCFDYFLCSGYLHEMKPDAAIYRAAIEISGRPAATGLFVDDKAENCAAARSAGMNAIQFETAAQLREELLRYGIETKGIQTT